VSGVHTRCIQSRTIMCRPVQYRFQSGAFEQQSSRPGGTLLATSQRPGRPVARTAAHDREPSFYTPAIRTRHSTSCLCRCASMVLVAPQHAARGHWHCRPGVERWRGRQPPDAMHGARAMVLMCHGSACFGCAARLCHEPLRDSMVRCGGASHLRGGRRPTRGRRSPTSSWHT